MMNQHNQTNQHVRFQDIDSVQLISTTPEKLDCKLDSNLECYVPSKYIIQLHKSRTTTTIEPSQQLCPKDLTNEPNRWASNACCRGQQPPSKPVRRASLSIMLRRLSSE